MKRITLKEISLENWKGQNRHIQFHDGINTISGRNGSGKTSIYKAFCWLLTAYTDADNVKNHELFDNRQDLSPDTPIATVRAVIDIDGTDVILERSAKCAFTRNRSTNEYVKSASDTYTLRIDDVETSAYTFNTFIQDTFGSQDLLQYMLIGNKFANLTVDDKNKARKVLESMVGEIKIEDMKGNYSAIASDIFKYGVDALKERYKNKLKPLKDRMTDIDTLVAFNEKKIAEIDTDFDAIKAEIDKVNISISDIDNEILGESKKLQPLMEQRDKIVAEIHHRTIELGEMRNNYFNAQRLEKADIEQQIRLIDMENGNIQRTNEMAAEAYNRTCTQIEQLEKDLDRLQRKRIGLIKQRNQVKELVFSNDTCQYCGQPLPYDKVEELRNKFNANKEEELALIIAEGKNVRAQIDEITDNIKRLQAVKDEGFTVLPYKKTDELAAKLKDIEEHQIPFEQTTEYKELCSVIDNLKSSIVEIKPQTDGLVEKKKELQSVLGELNRKYGTKNVIDELKHTITELFDEKKRVGVSIASMEGMLDKLKEYVEERANIVSERINTKLQTSKIVMYSRQKDGELRPDCVIVGNDGIKYATANNSSRIKCCIELQRMFAKHFDLSIPVFVDEFAVFDSLNAPVVADCQQINLCASDSPLTIS